MADFFTNVPLLCMLAVVGGLLWLCFKLASLISQSGQQNHDLSTLLAQALAGQQPISPKVISGVAQPVSPPVLPAPAKPVAAPSPSGAQVPNFTGLFGTAPPWFKLGLLDIGFHETGDNQGIDLFIKQAHTGALGDPWCAIWANAKLEQAGVPGTRSPSSQSFLSHPDFIQIATPVLGCLVVFWRNSKNSGLGHVGFYGGEDATRIWTLGGNENDMVQEEALPKDSPTFGFRAYVWPKSVPLPTTGPVMMPAGSPVNIQAPPTVSGATTIPATPAQNAEFSAMVAGGYFSSTPFDKSIPASIRTNNPGALNVAPWIKTAPGYVGDKVTSMSGAEANSTVIFSTPEYGVAAWFTLLQKYHAAGATTLSAIINRYGGGQDYSNYVAEVAAWSGLSEQADINLDDDATLLAFGKAMFRYEAGRPTPLSDAQILYGFNLARGPARVAAVPPVPPAAVAAQPPNVA
jgi:uncharacterized protein (TIGR02594 family)